MLCGWLSPQGKMYSCPYQGHYDLAYDLCQELGYPAENLPDEQLINHGWIKLFYSLFDVGNIMLYYDWCTKATEAQAAILKTDYETDSNSWNKQSIRDLKNLGVLDEEYNENGMLM